MRSLASCARWMAAEASGEVLAPVESATVVAVAQTASTSPLVSRGPPTFGRRSDSPSLARRGICWADVGLLPVEGDLDLDVGAVLGAHDDAAPELGADHLPHDGEPQA